MKDEKGIYSHRVLGWIFLSFLIFHFSFSFAKNDTIYNGTQIKLDIASPILTPATHQWQKQHYEVAVNVRLAKRWYPTAELGYATNGGGICNYGTLTLDGFRYRRRGALSYRTDDHRRLTRLLQPGNKRGCARILAHPLARL